MGEETENVVEFIGLSWDDAVTTIESALADYMLTKPDELLIRDARGLSAAWERILRG